MYIIISYYFHIYYHILAFISITNLSDKRNATIRISSIHLEANEGPILSPGHELTIHNTTTGKKRKIALGTVVFCHEDNTYYAITAGHCMEVGDRCWAQTGGYIGQCVAVIEFGVRSFVLFNDAWSQDIRRQIRQLYSHKVTHYVHYNFILFSHLLSHSRFYFYY